ncbi:rCG25469 [Rattus norvegicus]|uniref:RCG25469 n=1 Tax=Rattus norvegicus TaxID=10116 RepID=A6I211_RAT|nr:rCG25469 [Rattus norvegicus]
MKPLCWTTKVCMRPPSELNQNSPHEAALPTPAAPRHIAPHCAAPCHAVTPCRNPMP